jgi:hypothetical protein
MKNTSCAIEFHSQNYDAIMALQSRLLEQLKKFTDTFGKDFPQSDKETIELCIQKQLVGSAISFIRRQHINMHDRAARYAFWSIVDACNFFLDATTSRWTYVTMEDRKRYLGFSENQLSDMWNEFLQISEQAA